MKIVKEFILREIAGESILIPTGETTQEFNGMITMSDTAKFIWKNLESSDSFDEIVKLITDEYEIDEDTAKHDAAVFISALLKEGFIKCTREDGRW